MAESDNSGIGDASVQVDAFGTDLVGESDLCFSAPLTDNTGDLFADPEIRSEGGFTEEPGDILPVRDSTFTLSFRPFEIKTLRLCRRN